MTGVTTYHPPQSAYHHHHNRYTGLGHYGLGPWGGAVGGAGYPHMWGGEHPWMTSSYRPSATDNVLSKYANDPNVPETEKTDAEKAEAVRQHMQYLRHQHNPHLPSHHIPHHPHHPHPWEASYAHKYSTAPAAEAATDEEGEKSADEKTDSKVTRFPYIGDGRYGYGNGYFGGQFGGHPWAGRGGKYPGEWAGQGYYNNNFNGYYGGGHPWADGSHRWSSLSAPHNNVETVRRLSTYGGLLPPSFYYDHAGVAIPTTKEVKDNQANKNETIHDRLAREHPTRTELCGSPSDRTYMANILTRHLNVKEKDAAPPAAEPPAADEPEQESTAADMLNSSNGISEATGRQSVSESCALPSILNGGSRPSSASSTKSSARADKENKENEPETNLYQPNANDNVLSKYANDAPEGEDKAGGKGSAPAVQEDMVKKMSYNSY